MTDDLEAPLRLRLDISYDGTDFAGWAAQPGRRTVAGCIGQALTTLFRAQVPMVVAGRTDAGVHAAGQVAHVDVPAIGLVALAPRDGAADVAGGCKGLLRRLAGLLPADVRVRRVQPAPDGFDARFSALRRHYSYLIGTTEWGVDPLRRTGIWSLRRPLDVATMNRAAAALIGLHDFAAYCKPREGATTIRELQRISVRQQEESVRIEVSADAFCHSMVRSLVGALVAVGQGRAPVSAPAQLLAAARRTSQIHVAPAAGLTLMAVDYPADAELAERARTTRVVRQIDPLD